MRRLKRKQHNKTVKAERETIKTLLKEGLGDAEALRIRTILVIDKIKTEPSLSAFAEMFEDGIKDIDEAKDKNLSDKDKLEKLAIGMSKISDGYTALYDLYNKNLEQVKGE